ncbi:hypothetical protein KIN20_036130 [Parelaphostrongylus tenuis]|uniref:Uncharacterized protein n=1 Tax=Parelaphostrongylus tenuis TaxID=148309 RepID=A0AAD5RCW3_PARTN|nr:hypothetical protein KIN20_036130 [Parelaphostrongylus tenuis]
MSANGREADDFSKPAGKLIDFVPYGYALRNLIRMCDGIVGGTAVSDRFIEFKAKDRNLTHKQRAGSPQEIGRQAVLNATETSPSLTTYMLADLKDTKFYHRVIMKLPEKWREVIENERECFV